jgi:hypothetical protein
VGISCSPQPDATTLLPGSVALPDDWEDQIMFAGHADLGKEEANTLAVDYFFGGIENAELLNNQTSVVIQLRQSDADV